MLDIGDPAPDFTVPLANGEVESFTLSKRLHEAPLVLAFFPGAFTNVCSHEMSTLQQRLAAFEDAGATVYGVSVDSPFALNEFRDHLGLTFDLLSDFHKEVIEDYGVETEFTNLGMEGLAKRSVFVVNGEGVVTYAWVSDDPGVEPDYDELVDAVSE